MIVADKRCFHYRQSATAYGNVAPRLGFADSPNSGFVVGGDTADICFPKYPLHCLFIQSAVLVQPRCVFPATTFRTLQRYRRDSRLPIRRSLRRVTVRSRQRNRPNFRPSIFQQFNLPVRNELAGNVVTWSSSEMLGQHVVQRSRTSMRRLPMRVAPP